MWHTSELEEKREDLASLGVHKIHPRHEADIPQTAAEKDQRYKPVVHSLITRTGL